MNDVPPTLEQILRTCVPCPVLLSKRGVTVMLYDFFSRRSVKKRKTVHKTLS